MKTRKPRVLVVYNKYLKSGGGEEVMVKAEVDILKESGYEVLYKEYNNSNFQKFTFRSLFNPVRFFFSISSFIEIWRLVRKNKIDVVHVHNFFYTASPSVFWAAKFARAKTVVTLHNYKLFCLSANFFRDGKLCFSCYENKNFKPGIRHACFKDSRFASSLLAWSLMTHRRIGTWKHKIDHFIILNPFMQELLESIGVDPARITLKPNFISSPSLPEIRQKDDFYLFAGRLEVEKGIQHLIETFNRNGKPLIVAGSGSLSGWVKENAQPNITCLGLQTGPQVKSLMQKCKALIFPSIWIEGMPMTIIEAQAGGTILIAGETVNTSRMIADKKDGFLYEAGSSKALNRAIDTFEASTARELEEMNQQARQRYESRYTPSMHLAAIKKLYGEI